MKLEFEVKFLLAIRSKFFRNLDSFVKLRKMFENYVVLGGPSSVSPSGGHEVDGVPRALHTGCSTYSKIVGLATIDDVVKYLD